MVTGFVVVAVVVLVQIFIFSAYMHVRTDTVLLYSTALAGPLLLDFACLSVCLSVCLCQDRQL